jgi:hypothetical protein
MGTGYLDERLRAHVGGCADGSRFAYRVAEVDGRVGRLGQRYLGESRDRGRWRDEFHVAF